MAKKWPKPGAESKIAPAPVAGAPESPALQVDSVVAAPEPEAQPVTESLAASNPEVQIREDPALTAPQEDFGDLMRSGPRRGVMRGQGMNAPGESFDQFRGRTLPAIRGVMQEFAEGISQKPDFKMAVPVHSQVVKLAHAWIKNGAPDDFSIKPSAIEEHQRSGVERLFPSEKTGQWELSEAKDSSAPGIYFIHHAVNPKQADSYEAGNQQQKAIAQLSQRTQDLDFPRIKTWAQAAEKAGMSADDIGKYIDAALPDAKTVSKMSMPQILGVVALASPEKRQEYTPLLQSHFGDLSALPPDVKNQFAAHLAAIQNS